MSEEKDIFAAFGEAESGLDINQDLKKVECVEMRLEQPVRPLFNGREPLYTLKAERPEHRAVIMMAAAGMGNKEIANALGKTPQYVMYVKKQPWAEEQILREMETAGREPVIQLMKCSALEATETILDTMRTADSKKVRMEAAAHILDRVLGKATNKIEVTNKAPSEFTDAELAAIAAQGKKN